MHLSEGLRKKIGTALIIFTALQSAVIIWLYLEVLSEDLSFSAFLCILLIPVAIETAAICILFGKRRNKNDYRKHTGTKR